jgi:hypothetical protein
MLWSLKSIVYIDNISVGKEINLEEIGKRGIGKKGDFFLGKKLFRSRWKFRGYITR